MKSDTTNTLQPWQFFVLAALGCGTAVAIVVRGQGLVPVILLTMVMGATALVGLGVLRVVLPLLTPGDDRAVVVGRTRAALEQEKALVLRTIKELEFDRAMGKLSDDDFKEMGGRLRTRAARLITQLDSGESYRAQIEADLAKRLGPELAAKSGPVVCASCATANDPDAKFCKSCGERL